MGTITDKEMLRKKRGLMRQFKYEKVVDGESVGLPALREAVERLFPNHQQIISNIMRKHGIPESMYVKIIPCPDGDYTLGQGALLPNISIILSLAERDVMVLTLLHEIAHYHNPCNHLVSRGDDFTRNEIKIEKIALDWYGKATSQYLQKLQGEV